MLPFLNGEEDDDDHGFFVSVVMTNTADKRIYSNGIHDWMTNEQHWQKNNYSKKMSNDDGFANFYGERYDERDYRR